MVFPREDPRWKKRVRDGCDEKGRDIRCSAAICVSHHLFSSSAVDGGDVVGRSLGVERRMMDASEVTVLSFLTSRVWA